MRVLLIPVLYAANTTDFSSFGLGVLTDTISCEVTEERNGVFECLLKYPVSGQHYGLITKECIIKAKPNDTAADQAFRIYRITKPLNGIITIYGQHISYDLANVPVLPFSTESRSPQLILSQLLAGDTRFTGWTDYSDAKAFSVTQPKSVRACLGGTEGSMLSNRKHCPCRSGNLSYKTCGGLCQSFLRQGHHAAFLGGADRLLP